MADNAIRVAGAVVHPSTSHTIILHSRRRAYTAGMAKTYRPYVPEQDLLLLPSLRDWLPDDHLAYFVSDLVDELDLSAITLVYEDERGQPPYHPIWRHAGESSHELRRIPP